MKLASLLALTGLMAASGAQAFDWSDMYVGGNIGRATVAIPDNAMWFPGATAHSLSKDNTDTSYKIFAGSQILEFLAVEAGYASFGTTSATRSVTAPFVGTGTGSGKTQGLFADAVASYPINNNFSVLGRLGYGYYWTNTTNSVTGAATLGTTPAQTKSFGKGIQYGLGLQFNISKQVGLRIEWDRKPDAYVIGNEKVGIDNISAGILYRF